jgi:hypothetical protein
VTGFKEGRAAATGSCPFFDYLSVQGLSHEIAKGVKHRAFYTRSPIHITKMKKLLLLCLITTIFTACTSGPGDAPSVSPKDSTSIPTAVSLPEMENSSKVSFTVHTLRSMDYLFVAGYGGGITVVNLTNDSLQNILLTKQLH